MDHSSLIHDSDVQDTLSESILEEQTVRISRSVCNKRKYEEMCDSVFKKNKNLKTSPNIITSNPQSSCTLVDLCAEKEITENSTEPNLCKIISPFVCPACDNTQLDKEQMFTHIHLFHCDLNCTKLCNQVRHCRKKIWRCLACSEAPMFENEIHWKHHVTTFHIIQTCCTLENGINCIKLKKSLVYICSLCDNKFPFQLKLLSHFKTQHSHVNIKNLSSQFKVVAEFKFACSVCFAKSGYRSYFENTDSLIKHMISHHSSSSTNYQFRPILLNSDQNIGVSYSNFEYKEQKVQTVPICPICNRIFFNRYSLDGHIQNNHFSSINNEKISTHINLEYWKCNLCPSDSKYYLINFTDQYSFDEHVTKFHTSFNKFKHHVPVIGLCKFSFGDRNKKYLQNFATKIMLCSSCHLSFKSVDNIHNHVTNDNPSEAIRNIVSVVVCHTCWELWCCKICPKHDGVEAIYQNFDTLYEHIVVVHNYVPIDIETEEGLCGLINVNNSLLLQKTVLGNNQLILLPNNVSQSQNLVVINKSAPQIFVLKNNQHFWAQNNQSNIENPFIHKNHIKLLQEFTTQVSLLENNQHLLLHNNQPNSENPVTSNNQQLISQPTSQTCVLLNKPQMLFQNNVPWSQNSVASNNQQQPTSQNSLVKSNQESLVQNKQTYSENPAITMHHYPTSQSSVIGNNPQSLLQNNQTNRQYPDISINHQQLTSQNSLVKSNQQLALIQNKQPCSSNPLSSNNSLPPTCQSSLLKNNQPIVENPVVSNDDQQTTSQSSIAGNNPQPLLQKNTSIFENTTSDKNPQPFLKINQQLLPKPHTSQNSIVGNTQPMHEIKVVKHPNPINALPNVLPCVQNQQFPNGMIEILIKKHFNLQNNVLPTIESNAVNVTASSVSMTSANQVPSHNNASISCEKDNADKTKTISSKILTAFNVSYVCPLCKKSFSKCCELVKHVEIIHCDLHYNKLHSDILNTKSEIFECKGCKKNKNTLQECIKHMLRCTKLINIEASSNTEQLIIVQVSRFYCPFCNWDFNSQVSCKAHICRSHKSKRKEVKNLNLKSKLTDVYTCKYCSKRYPSALFKNIDTKIQKILKKQSEKLKNKEQNKLPKNNTEIIKVEPVDSDSNDLITIDNDTILCKNVNDSNDVSRSSLIILKTITNNDGKIRDRPNEGVKRTENEFMSDPLPCTSNVKIVNKICETEKTENCQKVTDLKLSQMPRVILIRLNLKPEHFSGKPVMLSELYKIKNE